MTDLSFSDHGTIWLMRANTWEGVGWIDEHIRAEPWQRIGDAIGIDHHLVRDLAYRAVADGLTVEGG